MLVYPVRSIIHGQNYRKVHEFRGEYKAVSYAQAMAKKPHLRLCSDRACLPLIGSLLTCPCTRACFRLLIRGLLAVRRTGDVSAPPVLASSSAGKSAAVSAETKHDGGGQ